MTKELKIFLVGVGLPALVLAVAGLRLVQLEYRRTQWNKARIEERARREANAAERRRDAAARQRGESFAPRHRRGSQEGPPYAGPRPRHFMRVFAEGEPGRDEPSSERTVWLGGCLLGLAFLSLVAGGWLLVSAAKRAREDALRKTDFLSNISHEFKTPLTTICLCAELAQDDGLSPERRAKALKSISAEADRLKGLVLNALDFSRLEKGRRDFNVVECDVARLARETLEPMAERFPAGLSLPEGECRAKADVPALRQIAVILLDNAAKYAASAPVEVSVSPCGGSKSVRLDVSDRGPGMDAFARRHAFDRFWRGDDAVTAETGGSGLGLAIAKHLAEGMGAKISVAPREGGGLVFSLELKC